MSDFGFTPDSDDEPDLPDEDESYLEETINQLLGNRAIIGAGEAEARQFLGDDRYDELMKYQDSLAEANRDAHFAQNELTRAFAARHVAQAHLLDTANAILSKWFLKGKQIGL